MPDPWEDFVSPAEWVDVWSMVGESTPPKPQPPLPVAAPPPPRQNILEQGLELLGRPQQALYQLAPGGGGIEGATQALLGGLGSIPGPPPRRTGEEVLGQLGVPEGEPFSINLPVLGQRNVTPRGVAGLATDILADPLLAFPAGRVEELQKGRALAEAGMTGALPQLRPIKEAAATLREGAPPTAMGMRELAQLPQAGRPLSEVLDAISPRILADTEPKAILRGYDSTMEQVYSISRVLSSQIGDLRAPEAGNRITLLDGSKKALGDVIEKLPEYEHLLDPADVATIHNAVALRDRAIQEVYLPKLEELRRVAPEAAKRFEFEFLPSGTPEREFIFNRFALAKAKPPEGIVPVSRRATFQQARQYETMEQGLAAGENYLPGLRLPMQRVFNNIYEQTALMDLSIALEPMAEQQELGALRELITLRKSLGPEEKSLRELAKEAGTMPTRPFQPLPTEVAAVRARRAETGAQIKELRTANESLTQDLRQLKYGFTKNLWLKPEDADVLESHLDAAVSSYLKGPLQAVGMGRTTLTVADLGAWAYQGLMAVVRDPPKGLQAINHMLTTFIDPETHRAYLAKDYVMDTMRRAPELMIHGGGAPREELYGEAEALGKVLTRLPAGKEILEPGLRKFQAAFEALGDYARVEWMRGVLPIAEKEGRASDMANLINHATGALSLRGMGVGPNQRAVESFLIFAPSYTRSAFAVIGDLMQGGAVSEEALKALGSLWITAPMIYSRAALLAGQEPVLDPLDSRFMTLEVGNERIGIGGVWTSLTRALGRALIDTRTGEFNPGKAWANDPNPLYDFWRGRQPAIIGQILQAAMGDTYSGLPLDNPIGLFTHLGTSILPISLQEYWIETGRALAGGQPQYKGATIRALANVAGFRSIPQPLKDLQQRVAQAKYGQDYRELTPEEQASVMQAPEIQALPERQGTRFAKERAVGAAFDKERAQLDAAAKMVDKGVWTRKDFREAAANEATALGTRLSDVEEKYGKREPSTDPREQKRQEYLDILRNQNLGEARYNQAEEFYNRLPKDIQGYIDSKQRARAIAVGGRAGDLLLELINDRRQLKPYWAIQDRVLKDNGLYAAVQKMSPAQFAQYQRSREYMMIQAQVSRARQMLRRLQPDLDKILMKWGYVQEGVGLNREARPPGLR